MIQLTAFILLSLVLAFISRASLHASRSHGFYRFFAWEFMLALFLLNAEFWFDDPFSWHQWIAWFLLFVCLIPLFFGVRSLTSQGKPGTNRPAEPQLLAFEKTSLLVTTGIYRYIRHPLYSSLLFLTWGIFFKSVTWLGVGLAFVATAFLLATALADEAECIRFFGVPYQEYMKRSKRFVPFVF